MAIVDDLINPRGAQRTCVVVLGGRGFLGRSLVTRLLQLGDWIVRVADSTPSLQLDADSNHGDSVLRDALASGLASYCQVDVRDPSQIIKGNKKFGDFERFLLAVYVCVFVLWLVGELV